MTNYSTNKLYFFDNNMPPVLKNGVSEGFGDKFITVNNYVIGSTLYVDKNFRQTSPETATYGPDPHWKIYPKDMWPSARFTFPSTWAFTNYSYSGHYIYYVPDNSGPTDQYSRLLRDHFDEIHYKAGSDNRNRDAQLRSEDADKKKQLTKFLKSQKDDLAKYTKESSRLIKDRDRDIRLAVRGGISKDNARKYYDINSPRLSKTLSSVDILKSNIETIKNDLK